MRQMRWLGLVIVGAVIASACSFGGDEVDSSDTGGNADDTTGEVSLESEAASSSELIANARLTVRSERAGVDVNGTDLPAGAFQEAIPGDLIEIEGGGGALITAESVFEIEALRGASVTVPDLSVQPLDVKLDFGHLFVRLNPEANTQVTVTTGERTFTTRTADAEFALCQGQDGASCLVVLAGEVEWAEADVASEVYSSGRATFAAQGNAPLPARCANQNEIGEMRGMLRGTDFSGVLAEIVDTWDECTAEDGPLVSEATLPSAARMEHVMLDEIVIGSPEVDEGDVELVPQKTLDGSADYYIEPLTATNIEFRTWLANTAGNDPDQWEAHAPIDWLERAPAGASTQAIYAPDTADLPVFGVSYETANAFCASQNKRLPTEIEWELAATSDRLEDLTDEAHDWETDWEAYGPGPDDAADRQVLRGTNAILESDLYYRGFAPVDLEATAARQNARVRCAASEVAIGGRAFTNVLVEEDFNDLGWPEFEDDPLELDYHPENYHLDVHLDHSQGAIVRGLESPLTAGRMDVDLFIERSNTGAPSNAGYRFGTVFGRSNQLYTLTVEPDEFSGNRFLACIVTLDPVMVEALDLEANPLSATSPGRPAMYGTDRQNHHGQKCLIAEQSIDVPVSNIDDPLRLSVVLVDGELEAWVNDQLVDTFDELSSIDVYGFFSQTYERPRSHIHYDDLRISK